VLVCAISAFPGCADSADEGPTNTADDGGRRPDDGRDAGPPPMGGGSGTISGSVQGTPFAKVGSAWWIGKPAAGSLPVMLFVSDVALSCATLSAEGWDKAIGDGQLLEMAVSDPAPGEYAVGTSADANYVHGAYNPTADGVTVTIGALNPMQNVTGSFDLTLAGDAVRGTFDAAWCGGGVEP
jgi:hypothetical protein